MGRTDGEDRLFLIDGKGMIQRSEDWRFDRNRTCCFTGHRPDKLPGGADTDSLGFMNMRSTAALHIYELVKRGYDTFITGMSRGFDLEMGELLLTDNRFSHSVDIVCAVPYIGQLDEMRTGREKEIYNLLLDSAAAIVLCSKDFSKGCYKLRNQFMVNYSSAVIGYMQSRGARSGTMQTVNMAKRAGLELHVMYGNENPQFLFGD